MVIWSCRDGSCPIARGSDVAMEVGGGGELRESVRSEGGGGEFSVLCPRDKIDLPFACEGRRSVSSDTIAGNFQRTCLKCLM